MGIIILISMFLACYSVVFNARTEQRNNQIEDELHALHHTLDIEIEKLKEQIKSLKNDDGKTL